MIIPTIHCDKCKKEIVKYEVWGTPKNVYELCIDCTTHIRDFIKHNKRGYK